ncbi:hypothetical protein [Arthrobacter sp. TS-15]|nr:hypothetical protein [Arthrobacter sp. TS-15]
MTENFHTTFPVSVMVKHWLARVQEEFMVKRFVLHEDCELKSVGYR